MRSIIVVAVTASLALGCGGGGSEPATGADLIAEGDRLFHGEGTCQTCHGADLRGTTMGPPFLDDVYAPGHHPDSAFRRAVEQGVRPHHWDFGPMPALPHLDADDVRAITAYVRSEQRKAGIE